MERFPRRALADGARGTAVVALTLSATLVAALHAVRPDRSPVTDRLSEYASGPFGWLMVAAFICAGLGLLAMGLTVPSSNRHGWLFRLALWWAGAGLIVSGIFPTGASPVVEVVHSRASALATVTLTGVAIAWSLQSAGAARSGRAQLVLAGAAGVAAAASPLLHDTAYSGMGQRSLWGLLMVWALVALRGT